MAPIWLHCNICRRTARQVSSRLNLTNCGFCFCWECRGATTRRFCQDCQGRCRRNVPLDRKAPREVRKLFESVATKINK